MRFIFIVCIAIFSVLACNSNKSLNKNNKVIEVFEKQDSCFLSVSSYPKINDSLQFITYLKRLINLEAEKLTTSKSTITTYRKVEIYGSEQFFYFIEVDYKKGPQVSFPWKFQLILDSKGKLVKSLNALRFEFVEIMKDENPFLLILTSTSKGNGVHQLYKVSSDTLENVLERNFNTEFHTYDAQEDNTIYEPYELKFNVKDFKRDS